jgi:hypothetical protein
MDDIARHVTAPVSMDIFETGYGQAFVRGQNWEEGGSAIDISRDGRMWVAADFPDDSPTIRARTPFDLARKVAERYGVTGLVSVNDERPSGRYNGAFEHTAKEQEDVA